MKIIVRLLIFKSLLFATAGLATAQVLKDQPQKPKFEFDEIHNSSKHQNYGTRYVYILVSESDFTLTNIRQLFSYLSAGYRKPALLTVKLFTDMNRLKKMIDYDNPGVSISFMDTEAGRQAQQKWNDERYPKAVGYYAEYVRDYYRESFHYSPKKNDSILLEIVIKKTAQSKNNRKNRGQAYFVDDSHLRFSEPTQESDSR